MKRAYLFCAGLALAACQTKPIAPHVVPMSCPPSLTHPVPSQPIMPESANVPRPASQADSDGLDAFLAHVGAVAAWGRSMAARATVAKTYCEGVQ